MSFHDEYEKILQEYNNKARIEERERLKEKLSQKPVVLFGAAWIGDFVYERLVSWGIQPICFADNFAIGTTPNGHGPILKPSDIQKQCSDCYILLTIDRAREQVCEQLIQLGYPAFNIIQNIQPIMNQMEIQSIRPILGGYEWAYNFFDDIISKRVILERIKCLLMGNESTKSASPQYFEKGLFSLTDTEVFVDGGFFTGDTAEEFIRQADGRYRMIYGFEPDKYVREMVPESLKSERIQIVPAGLYSETGETSFMTTRGESRATGGNILGKDASPTEDIITIPTVALDDFFSDKPPELQPTFIKMDIEGSERSALEGAEYTIRTYRPKLAICVYHKLEDIYDLPKLIQNISPDYHFTLRHYGHFCWETVMYAF